MKEIKIQWSLSEDARKIRQTVFVEEQGFQNEFDETDKTALHCVCYTDGIPVAVGRTFPNDEGGYTIGRIAVQKAMRGTGLGRTVVLALEKAAKAEGAKHFTLLSQLRAVGFYQTLGYRQVGAVVYDEFCPHVKMQKILKRREKVEGKIVYHSGQ